MFDSILSIAIRLASTSVILGWLLSALGQLNLRGYLLGGLPTLLLIAFFARREQGAPVRFALPRRLARWWRGRRLLPLVYLLTFALVALGSVLHEPNNFDALCYRSPKILYWLEQGHWHWVNTPFKPVNTTMPNFEWLTVPLFLLTHGFHAAVVLNWIAFLLLPSLFFSLLRGFGAPGRVACDWMWLLPSGYLIVMLAGGLGNDLAGLAALLAALHCANRFVASGKAGFLFDALLAAGFSTGVKLTNVPLPLFVGIILLGKPGRLRAHRVALVAGIVLGGLSSALIPMWLNLSHSGSILGTTGGEEQTDRMLAGILGNGWIVLESALLPPMLPGADRITHLLETGLGGLAAWIHTHYFKFNFKLNELAQEETGALGLGITLALVLMVVSWWRARRGGTLRPRQPKLVTWQRIAWWSWFGIAMLVVAGKLGTGDVFPRNVLPWFSLPLVPMVAFFGCEAACRSRVWRILAPLLAMSVLPAVLITPSRPLIPPPLILDMVRLAGVSPPTLDRIRLVYETYGSRADPFAPLRAALPPETRVIGLVTQGCEATSAWWLPYGSRRCVYVNSEADLGVARKAGLRYVMIQVDGCAKFFNLTPDEWMKAHQARPIKTIGVRIFARVPLVYYTLAELEN